MKLKIAASITAMIAALALAIPASPENRISTRVLTRVPIESSPALEKIISCHVKKICDQGYAMSLTEDDFYHGHLILAEEKTYNAIDEMISDLKAIVYHTDESGKRWYMSKTPRSIVGFIDCSLTEAGNLIIDVEDEFPDKELFIKWRMYGTIGAKVLKHFNEEFGRDRQRYLILVDGKEHRFDTMFFLKQDQNGKYNACEKDYDIFFYRLE